MCTIIPLPRRIAQVRGGHRPREAQGVRFPQRGRQLPGGLDLAGIGRPACGPRRPHGTRALLPALLCCRVWRAVRSG